MKYFKQELFLPCNENPARRIFTYETHATDKQIMQNIITTVVDILIKKILDQMGLM